MTVNWYQEGWLHGKYFLNLVHYGDCYKLLYRDGNLLNNVDVSSDLSTPF